ncbi:MAG TPA: tetratricopeptide repeat protein [Candidatus Saccharimonadales bacterium]|nr:tetratricopeptide repeat protein [Candidatus Saccharimonadales bacterium]
MPEKKKEIVSYVENVSLLMVGLLFVLFPVFFLSSTTDAFVLPKELLLIILSSLSLLIFGIKAIVDGKLRLRTSPFDVPMILFIIVVFLSAIFSADRYDALIASAPLLFVGFLYFVIINVVKNQKQLLFLLSTLTLGAVISSLLSIFSFFNIYLLPFSYTHAQYFTTFGSLLDQAIYYALILPIAGYFGYAFINGMSAPKQAAATSSPFSSTTQTHRKRSSGLMAIFAFSFIVIGIALGLTVYMLFTSQKPLILPFDIGLQTGFAAISQNNVFKSLFLGSGYGTYLNDFTQFKPAAYNTNEALWAFTFFRSSSFLLELLATTGLLGIAVFGIIMYRIFKEKNFFLPLMLGLLAAIFLPFSFTLTALFFILLALFGIVCVHNNPQRFGEAEFSLLALRRGLLGTPQDHTHQPNTSERRFSKIFPSIFMIIIVAVVGIPLYFITRFIISDFTFQQSLIAESQNNGLATYQLQTAAIQQFPYRDIYYRSFSQTNLALANALAVNHPKNASPSAQTQKDILTLIQQSINAGRAAVTVAPATSFDWNNLSSIYRSLIGFGQNADQFTILTANQAIALDPNNPQQYIDLGGVYYQLGKYEDAIREFQIALNLKPNYANAYYNLGHAYQQINQFPQAMEEYRVVKQLVAGNETNTKLIDNDIAALNDQINAAKNGTKKASAAPVPSVTPAPQDQNQPITVNKAATTLPPHNPKEKIPAPGDTSSVQSPSPSPAADTSPAPTKASQ